MSTDWASDPPTGRTSLLFSARSSLAWTLAGISPISSRKSVPTLGDAEQTGRAGGAGECAALVAEQLALDDRFGQRAAVDGHERPVGAQARAMDGARHQLLARAALALDEHLTLVVTQALDGAVQRTHARRVPHQLDAGSARAELLFQLTVAAHQAPALDGLAHGGPHAVDVFEGLGQVVEGAAPHGPDGRLHAGVAGHHDDLHLGALALHARQQIHAALPVHHQVEQHDVEVGVAQRALGLLAGLRRHDAMAFGAKDALERSQQEGLVVDQQDESGELVLLVGHARVVCEVHAPLSVPESGRLRHEARTRASQASDLGGFQA